MSTFLAAGLDSPADICLEERASCSPASTAFSASLRLSFIASEKVAACQKRWGGRQRKKLHVPFFVFRHTVSTWHLLYTGFTSSIAAKTVLIQAQNNFIFGQAIGRDEHNLGFESASDLPQIFSQAGEVLRSKDYGSNRANNRELPPPETEQAHANGG